jgi:lipoyl-dependent peroxiredoxin
MKEIYQTSVTVTGGRNGQIKSDDGILDLQVRIPKEMGGAGGATNPEQLFAGGYAACFDSALNGIMRAEKVKAEGPSEIKAEVKLGQADNGAYQLAVKLSVHIPGLPAEQVHQLVEKAHQVCPYSNATRGNIEVELSVY